MPLFFKYFIASVTLGFLLPFTATAQSNAQQQGLRCKSVVITQNTLELDTLSIVPNTISFSDTALRWHYDWNTNQITLLNAIIGETLFVCYRTFPFLINKKYFNRSIIKYDSGYYAPEMVRERSLAQLQIREKREELFASPGLNKSGNITRGISFGNTQNVFVNSSLNLQLEGKISENIQLKAVLSDQNVPFQPEGNTQQVQDFDRVYVELAAPKGKLAAGDIVLKNPNNSYFSRYLKNVQGGQFTANYGKKGYESQTQISAAIAKGKFRSYFITVQDGVQGPYRLTGSNNESFIIVLANSEKIWLDGKQLERGFNYDYVIDYNNAEITFNTNVVITQFSRVRVDFEYAERNYNRTILQAGHTQQVKKWKFAVNHYQESDNPNRPLSFQLDTATSRQLAAAGNVQQAIVNSAVVVPFTEEQILYIKKDTLGDSIFVFTAQPQARVFRVVFSQVGQGNGAYRQITGVANGRIFEWVGQGNGDFEPVLRIPLPNKKTMTTFQTNYQIDSLQNINLEVALSEFDRNRYSSLGQQENSGQALRLNYHNAGTPMQIAKQTFTFAPIFNYELVGKNFNAIDRFREVEFDRNWSANEGDTLRANDHLIEMGFKLQKNEYNKLFYKSAYRNKMPNISGWQHQAALHKSLKRVQTEIDWFQMNGIKQFENTKWQRLSTKIYLKKYLSPGYQFQLDKNVITASQSPDSVLRTAMNFESHTLFLKNADTAKTNFHVNYTWRNDYLPVEGRMNTAFFTQTAQATLKQNSEKAGTLQTNVTYRNLQNQLFNSANEETVMGRIDWQIDAFRKIIRSELTLVANTGRELRREYQFIRVLQPGEGTHQWIDFNENGIKELDEFVEATRPEDRLYIKIFVPTNKFITAYSNEMNYRLIITPPATWKKGNNVLYKNLAKFSLNTNWTAGNKTTSQDIFARFLPIYNLRDEELLTTKSSIRSTLFFNRANPNYGGDLQYINQARKQLLTNGFEKANNEEIKLNTRINIKQMFNLQTTLLRGQKLRSSDFLQNRNYTILENTVSPELSWQPNGVWRITGGYGFSQKSNILKTENPEKALVSRWTGELRYSKVGQRMIQATISYVQIRFENGSVQSPLAYEMLEALLPGSNWTWNLNWQQKLFNGLQLTVSYDGRKSETQRTVHLARMQVSALF